MGGNLVRVLLGCAAAVAANVGTANAYDGPYSIEGGADSFFGTGVICHIAKRFLVEGSGVSMEFVPNPDKAGVAGTYSYAGVMSGFRVWGEGTYEVHAKDGKATSITGIGPGSVATPMGIQSRVDEEHYTLKPTTDPKCV